jgi:hypothetical protein
MFWWFRKLFWWPQWKYEMVVGTSFASAEEAMRNAMLAAQKAGGDPISIAADAMCCSDPDGGQSRAEWNVYILLRR